MKNWVAKGIASDVNDFTLELFHCLLPHFCCLPLRKTVRLLTWRVPLTAYVIAYRQHLGEWTLAMSTKRGWRHTRSQSTWDTREINIWSNNENWINLTSYLYHKARLSDYFQSQYWYCWDPIDRGSNHLYALEIDIGWRPLRGHTEATQTNLRPLKGHF